MKKVLVTQTSLKERFIYSGAFAIGSSVLIAGTQYFMGERVEQILRSSETDFAQTYVSSLVNQTIYNWMKRYGSENFCLSEKQIVVLSATLVSVFGVGIPKYFFHKMAHTNGIELISLIYVLGNILTLLVYEKAVLQKKHKT